MSKTNTINPFYYNWLFIFLFGLIALRSQAQSLRFVALYDELPLSLNTKFPVQNSLDSIEISTLKFYISNIELRIDTLIVATLPQYHYLVDFKKEQSQVIQFSQNITFNNIRFHLGIDSLTNSKGAMGKDLDPTNGMYWTWQSGYINFKLEGNSKICPTRNHKFQFHLGGYQFPYNALRTIDLETPTQKNITIYLDISTFLNQITLQQETYTIMSPGSNAMTSATLLATLFRLKP